jgi:DMSO/TMAO reductase YedYZ molybdopterin-dependent catalytic subunit
LSDATRRRFLFTSASAWASFQLGCTGGGITLDSGNTGTPPTDTGDTGTAPCPDPFADGELLGTLSFTGEEPRELETLTGSGLDGRYVLDLSSLTPEVVLVPVERFFVRTGEPDRVDRTEPWTVELGGLVEAPASVLADDLVAASTDQGVVLIECSGNTSYGGFGLMSTCAWQGVPLSDLLDQVTPSSSGALIQITGFDDHSQPSSSTAGASWIFTPEQLADAFLATHMDGEPLTQDHGLPVRLVIPGWYGCACIKWVDGIDWVPATADATSQMKEFASRTHQDGNPSKASDYAAARMELSAVPIRVEKWRVEGELVYRVVGLVWGGDAHTDRLQLSADGTWETVTTCPGRSDALSWAFWEHTWRPTRTGAHELRMRVDDAAVPQIRLDDGWYVRTVVVDET